MAKPSDIKAKIAALRAKTTRAGCTEAEAAAAAAVAAELMSKHGLADEDLVMTEAEMDDPTSGVTWRTKLATMIAYCTNTSSIILTGRGLRGSIVKFIGRAPGPEIAVYLRDVCLRAVEHETREFSQGEFYRRRRSSKTRRQALDDFRFGMVDRLCARLAEMFKATLNEGARIEAKGAARTRFGEGKTVSLPSRQDRFAEASDHGWLAGGGVSLNHGVASGADTLKRIGRTQ